MLNYRKLKIDLLITLLNWYLDDTNEYTTETQCTHMYYYTNKNIAAVRKYMLDIYDTTKQTYSKSHLMLLKLTGFSFQTIMWWRLQVDSLAQGYQNVNQFYRQTEEKKTICKTELKIKNEQTSDKKKNNTDTENETKLIPRW